MDSKVRIIARELRRFREEEARRLHTETYRIFQNQTIELLANLQPKTNLELLNVKGIGPKKAKLYGARILRIIENALTAEKESVQQGTGVSSDAGADPGAEKVYSVGEFLDLLNSSLARKRVAIRGEIGPKIDRTYSATYFTVKDEEEEAVVSCFAWNRVLDDLGFALESGTEVVIYGVPGIYKPSGRFSINTEEILLTGEGALLKALEELKKKLSAEGLFAPERKRPIPSYIRRIGLVTAKGSDAERDVITHVASFGIRISRYDVRVEGVKSIETICAAVEYLNHHYPGLDVILITRGGGSFEAMQAFNSERVARTICASKIPVLTAIGHTKDVSIADMVADLSLATPTKAGEYISESWNQALQTLREHYAHMASALGRMISHAEQSLDLALSTCVHRTERSLERANADLAFRTRMLEQGVQRIFETFARVEQAFKNTVDMFRAKRAEILRTLSTIKRDFSLAVERSLARVSRDLVSYANQLALADPNLKLKQGYSIVYSHTRSVVTSLRDIETGEKIRIRLSDGSIISRVEEKEEEE